MSVLNVKGVAIGEGRPKTIVSLMDRTRQDLVASARRAVAAGAELLEWRADYADDLHDPVAVVETSRALCEALPTTPLVFTFRSRGQGGQADLAPAAYQTLCRAVIEARAADIVDLELGLGDAEVRALMDVARLQGVATIVSYHDFAATPDTPWMCDCFAHMAELGVDLPKLAVMAQSHTDCLRLMEAAATARRQLAQPLVAIAMGAYGGLSRLAGEACGSALTFCALEAASAPGQVALPEAKAAMDALHEALEGSR